MAKSSTTVNVKPLADRVLVEAAPAETKTAGGLIIPDTAKEKPQRQTSIDSTIEKLKIDGLELAPRTEKLIFKFLKISGKS